MGVLSTKSVDNIPQKPYSTSSLLLRKYCNVNVLNPNIRQFLSYKIHVKSCPKSPQISSRKSSKSYVFSHAILSSIEGIITYTYSCAKGGAMFRHFQITYDIYGIQTIYLSIKKRHYLPYVEVSIILLLIIIIR